MPACCLSFTLKACRDSARKSIHNNSTAPEVLFETCVAMKFVDDDDDNNNDEGTHLKL